MNITPSQITDSFNFLCIAKGKESWEALKSFWKNKPAMARNNLCIIWISLDRSFGGCAQMCGRRREGKAS